jgi:integrase
MRGLSRRKESSVWQGRVHIPTDLWNNREKLKSLGIKVPKVQNYTVSLKERDQGKAELAYQEVKRRHDSKMLDWHLVLSLGPVSLDHKQIAALAGHAALRFVSDNESNPEGVSAPMALLRFSFGFLKGALREAGRLPVIMGDPFEEFLQELQNIPLLAIPAYLDKEIDQDIGPYRQLLIDHARETLQAYRGQLGGELVGAALAEHSLTVDQETRAKLEKAGAVFAGKALDTLKDRLDYTDFDTPSWSRGVPQLELPTRVGAGSPANRSSKAPDLFKLLEEKVEVEKKRPATRDAYSGSLKRFKAFAGHVDPTRITKQDVLRWRNEMMLEGLDTATINKKHLAALKAVLEWGRTEGHLETNVAEGVLDKRSKEPDRQDKGHERETIEAILAATFKGTIKKPGLSVSFKRGLFWIPWLLAYTGLRPVEVAQLRGEDVREEGGIPFLLITPEAGTTKGGNAWITGIHAHLLELGFVKMARAVGPGPLFYNPYAPGTDLRTITSPRSIEAYSEVSDWIRDELGVSAFRGRRLHAFRHAMTTHSRGGGTKEDAWDRLDKETRDYMMGSRSKSDAREGYGKWAPEVIDREINKLPRFNILDPGTRPYLE